MIETMLTTVDNPHDPFDDFDNWYAYDARQGYNTPSLLARLTFSSDELSEADQALAIHLAMKEIIEIFGVGFYKQVSREVKPKDYITKDNDGKA